jgi:hypothetical protein
MPAIPTCPFPLVDILRFLGALSWYPEVEGVEEAIEWLAVRIHEQTGIPRADISEAIHRLPLGRGLEGSPPGSLADAYATGDAYLAGYGYDLNATVDLAEAYGGP